MKTHILYWFRLFLRHLFTGSMQNTSLSIALWFLIKWVWAAFYCLQMLSLPFTVEAWRSIFTKIKKCLVALPTTKGTFSITNQRTSGLWHFSSVLSSFSPSSLPSLPKENHKQQHQNQACANIRRKLTDLVFVSFSILLRSTLFWLL